MPTHFLKRSELGRHQKIAKARMHTSGNLNFSRLAGEAFAGMDRAMVEFDDETRVMTFTAVGEKLPRGLPSDFTREDLFIIHYHKRSPKNTFIAMKGILSKLKIEYNMDKPFDVEIESVNLKEHSVSISVPLSMKAPRQVKPQRNLEPANVQLQAAAG